MTTPPHNTACPICARIAAGLGRTGCPFCAGAAAVTLGPLADQHDPAIIAACLREAVDATLADEPDDVHDALAYTAAELCAAGFLAPHGISPAHLAAVLDDPDAADTVHVELGLDTVEVGTADGHVELADVIRWPGKG